MKERQVWVTLAIVAIWIAVGVTAASGGEFVSVRSTSTTEVPAAWGVAFFAALATAVVAFFGYRGS